MTSPAHTPPPALKSLSELASQIKISATPDAAPSGHSNIRIDWVDLAALLVDPAYQRTLSYNGKSRIKRIVADFEWSKFGALTLSQSDAGTMVIDGQHRAIAAYILGILSVPAVILPADQAGQANSFVGINAERGTVNPIDKFHARVTAGDPAATRVAEILTNLDISTDARAGCALGPRQTRAVVIMERIAKTDAGRGLLFTSLEMLLEAQPDVQNLLTRFNIDAVTVFLGRIIDANGDLERALKVLQDTDLDDIKEEARTILDVNKSGQLSHHGADRLLHRYNHNLQRRIA